MNFTKMKGFEKNSKIFLPKTIKCNFEYCRWRKGGCVQEQQKRVFDECLGLLCHSLFLQIEIPDVQPAATEPHKAAGT